MRKHFENARAVKCLLSIASPSTWPLPSCRGMCKEMFIRTWPGILDKGMCVCISMERSALETSKCSCI